tara:strand:- start:443 stop:619 length:177 start_codon:yes stop_codon:yes gene_type:complete
MRKRILIDQVESILKKEGFNNNDYIVSLQGPTVILTQSGNDKITEDIKNKIKESVEVI